MKALGMFAALAAVIASTAWALSSMMGEEPAISSAGNDAVLSAEEPRGEVDVPPILTSRVPVETPTQDEPLKAAPIAISELDDENKKLVRKLNRSLKRLGHVPFENSARVSLEDLQSIREVLDFHGKAWTEAQSAVHAAYRPQINEKKQLVKDAIAAGEDPPFEDVTGKPISREETNPYLTYVYRYNASNGRSYDIKLVPDTRIAQLITDARMAKEAWAAAVIQIAMPMVERK